MNILFDIGHPAHVHLFKHFINHLNSNGHNCVIAIRDKDVTRELLNEYGIEYLCLTHPKTGLINLFIELLIRDWKIFKLHKQYKFGFAFGTSVSISHLAAISRVVSFNFNEDDDQVVPLFSWLSYPFTTYICSPSCLKFKYWEPKRLIHNSYHELAYLHPEVFEADENILKKYNLEKKKYIIARFSALTAHHDKNAKGINEQLWLKIKALVPKNYKIVISIENNKSHHIAPYDMHHILNYAKLIISDSQTMTAESAVLGVPSIRCNTFVGKISYLEELEYKYRLTYGFLPEHEKKMLQKINNLFSNPDLEKDFSFYRQKLLKEKIELTQWMIKLFENKKKNSSYKTNQL